MIEPGAAKLHPRTVGWLGTTAVAMGGINQSLFLINALFVGQEDIPGQGSAAVVLLAVGLLLSWAATPGWTELIMMYPNRVGGIAATCAEAFRPYSPVLSNLTGVCYWWGWIPTCGLTALLASSAIHQQYLPSVPIPLLATGIVLFFTAVSLCGVKWIMRLAIPIATASATLAFLSAVIPIFSGSVDWQRAFTFQLTVPFPGWFGEVTSVMAGLYLIGFAAPAFEQAACHVGETVNPKKNVPRAMFTSAALASLYFVVLPIIWLGTLGPEPLGKELALQLGPTFAPLLGGAAISAAIWFMIFNMLHGTIAPLAGAARTLAQLSEDGLLPEFLALRSRTDAPWASTLFTAGMAILFLWIGDPIWLVAAANLTYLIGIALPSVAVWLLRRNEPGLERPYRAPRGTIWLGVAAAATWGLATILGFQQFGLPTVVIGVAFAYAGSALYAWRRFSDRRKAGLPGIARTLHIKLTGAMLIVLVLDAAGYLIAVNHVPDQELPLITMLEDIFVVVALLTISVGLILPGMIAHSAVEVSHAAEQLVVGTLADFTRAMEALAAGDLDAAKAEFKFFPIVVNSADEVGDMALSFNRLQEEIGRAAEGLEGARIGLSLARSELTATNQQLSEELVVRTRAQQAQEQAEIALRRSLQDKETLLKEIHHRVKNNLQIISSLLSMQADTSISAETQDLLQESIHRVRTMSLIHERLYQSVTLDRIDFGEYTRSLAEFLLRSYQVSGQVQLLTDTDPVELNIETAVPAGLVLNELVTNALKYAFTDGNEGRLSVSLHNEGEGTYKLTVADTGPGLPVDFEVGKATTLGLQLVESLTRQLKGTLNVQNEEGVVFNVTFRELAYAAR